MFQTIHLIRKVVNHLIFHLKYYIESFYISLVLNLIEYRILSNLPNKNQKQIILLLCTIRNGETNLCGKLVLFLELLIIFDKGLRIFSGAFLLLILVHYVAN